MNIRDLKPGSYTVVTPQQPKMNIEDLQPGSYTVVNPVTPTPKLSPLEEKFQDVKQTGTGIMESLRNTGSKFKESYQANEKKEQTPIETGVQYAGTALGGVFGAGMELAKGAVKLSLPQSAETGIKNVLTGVTKKAVETKPVKSAISKYQSFSPRTQRNIEAGTEILSTIPVVEGAKLGIQGGKFALKGIEKGVETGVKTAQNMLKTSDKVLEKEIVKQFEKGVKPLLPARATPQTTVKYKNDVVEAVKTINENKNQIKFADEFGEKTITGRNPKTLQELADAQDQSKKIIFEKYDSLAKQAGDKGLVIKTDDLAPELDSIIGNPALQITNPEAIRYAQGLKKRFFNKELDAKTAQDVIQNYNKSLDAFYQNPTYESSSKASIDALIANKLRQKLDDGVTGLTGEQYQALKNQYKSLKTVERDIIKAAIRDARKNNKSLLDYTDILTGGDAIAGIVTLNPGLLARGATARGIKEFYKYLNSPNRAIKKIFKSVEKTNQRFPPNSQSKPSSTNSPIPSGSTLLANQPKANIPATPSMNPIPKSSTIKKDLSNELEHYTPEQVSKVRKEVLKDTGGAVVIDPDAIKKMHPKYSDESPYVLHEDSSALSKKLFTEAVDKDKSGIVAIIGGGSGSGKSEVVLNAGGLRKRPSVVFDFTLSKLSSASEKIDYALSKGKKVEIRPVYTPIELATLFNKMRKRSVGDSTLIDAHFGFRDTVPQISEKYGNKVKIIPYENAKFGDKAFKAKASDDYFKNQALSKEEIELKVNRINDLISTMGIEDVKKVINSLLD